MARTGNLARKRATTTMETTRLRPSPSPEIASTLAEFRAQFRKYAIADLELRKLVDKAMPSNSLTEELYRMREGK